MGSGVSVIVGEAIVGVIDIGVGEGITVGGIGVSVGGTGVSVDSTVSASCVVVVGSAASVIEFIGITLADGAVGKIKTKIAASAPAKPMATPIRLTVWSLNRCNRKKIRSEITRMTIASIIVFVTNTDLITAQRNKDSCRAQPRHNPR